MKSSGSISRVLFRLDMRYLTPYLAGMTKPRLASLIRLLGGSSTARNTLGKDEKLRHRQKNSLHFIEMKHGSYHILSFLRVYWHMDEC